MSAHRYMFFVSAAALLLAACSDSPTSLRDPASTDHFGSTSDWSTPVELGSAVNMPGSDNRNAFETADGRSLYFAAANDQGIGGRDIWVSHRANPWQGWGAAKDLGATVNSPADDFGDDNHPMVTPDGHWLLFNSSRDGGCGGQDIWVSFRKDVRDDFGWERPTNPGCAINSDANDKSPTLFYDFTRGVAELYFVSDRGGEAGDVYRVIVTPLGVAGAPQLMSALSSDGDENKISISHDGLEAFISSDRISGNFSIWMSTRRSTRDDWSAPKLIVSGFGLASVSFDERRLYLTAPGVEDPTVAAIYTSTRVHAGSMQDKVAESRGALPLDAFAGRTAR